MVKLRGYSLIFFATVIEIFYLHRTVLSTSDSIEIRYKNFKVNSICKERELQCGQVLATIVNNIIELYTQNGKAFCVIVGKQTEPDFFEDILKMEGRNVIMMMPGMRNFELHHITYQKITNYVLLNIEFTEIKETLANFGIIGGTWNPRGLYISIAESKEEAARMMKSLWSQFIYKVVVLVFCNNSLDTIEAYTWRPYHPRGYCGPPTTENLVKLGTFTDTLEFEKETDDVQPGMTPEKFGNCPINITLKVWEPYVFSEEDHDKYGQPSIEISIIDIIYKKIGLEMKPTFQSHRIPTPGEIEAMAGAFLATASDIENFDVTVPYIQDSFIWIVPQYRKNHRLFDLYQPYSLIFWIAIVHILPITMVSLKLAKTRHWILWVYGSMFDQPIAKIPRKIRGIWICWLILCLHLTNIYKTVLFHNLTDPAMEYNIKNQSDLYKSGLKLTFMRGAAVFFDKDNEVENWILKHYIPCNSMRKCYKEIPTGKAVFTNKLFANYLNGEMNISRPVVETVRQLPPSLNIKVSMVYVKGHPVTPVFNKYMLFMSQAGLVRYWMDLVETMQTRINAHKLSFTKDNKLTISELKEVFYYLIGCLSIAGILFICEILNNLLKKKKKKNTLKLFIQKTKRNKNDK